MSALGISAVTDLAPWRRAVMRGTARFVVDSGT